MLLSCVGCGAAIHRMKPRADMKCEACKKLVHRAANRRWFARHPGYSTQAWRDREARLKWERENVGAV